MKNKLNDRLEEEKKLSRDEFKQELMVKGVVHLCEQEQRSFFREGYGDDVDKGTVESLLDYVGSSNQYEDLMSEASNETIGSYV